ncbi:hypothetical protein E2562_027764 [Oryza meyeriana var. granulata]|uniref:Uncharacterized protein n=1 Tax=Oryza meyeriana var. granulata TaxID=110450 RepID=A0A6G1EC24_9ORYZ|nr:hypothetical protein E2562_027764 [Oryza meyeriana var. granulata]
MEGREEDRNWGSGGGRLTPGMNFKNLLSREYYGHKKKVHSVAWNCLGTRLASGSTDHTACVEHLSPWSHEIAWNKTGDLFFTTTGLRHVEVISYPSFKTLCKLNAHTAGCYCIGMDPLDRYFAVGSADSPVSLWDVKELLCVKTFTKLDYGFFQFVTFLPLTMVIITTIPKVLI